VPGQKEQGNLFEPTNCRIPNGMSLGVGGVWKAPSSIYIFYLFKGVKWKI
jgi:hypothetical protein